MRLHQLTGLAFEHFFKRLAWRAFGFALLSLFTLIALYHGTVAGTLALESEVGMVHARLIVFGFYVAAALVTLVTLLATRTKTPALARPNAAGDALASSQTMQIAALMEAAMLGYTLARKGERR